MADLPVIGATASVRRAARAALVAVAALACFALAADAAPAKRKARAPKKIVAAKVEAAPQPPADPARDAWERARALAESDRHDEALATIREALARFPDDTGLLWLEATVTGWSGKHDDAVSRFETLLAKHPEMARDLRSDLAAERLWSGDAAGAVRDYDLRLEEDPSDRDARKMRALALSHADRLPESLAAYDALLAETPGDPDLALERARVLGWMGRHPQAADAYRAVLASRPGDARARLGLAQNENWRGEHRRAAALFEQLEAEKVDDPDVQRGLAWAWYWAGDSERSRAALGRFLTRHPDDPEGRKLAATLARENGRQATFGYDRSDDSDALRVRTTWLEWRQPFAGRSAWFAGWRKHDVQDGAGNRDPWRFTAGLEHVWSPRWSGRLAGTYLEPSDEEKAFGLGEAGLVHRPSDRVRIDLGWEKDMPLTRLALASNVRVNSWVAGVDWQATERLMLHADERLLVYNDENRQVRFSGSAALRFSRARGELAVSMNLEHLQSDLDLDHGYYDPSRYLEFGPGVAIEWRPAERFTLGFEGKLGWQNENDDDREPFTAFTASAGVPLGSVFQAHVEGGQSDSNLSSASGFRQKRWAASITTGF